MVQTSQSLSQFFGSFSHFALSGSQHELSLLGPSVHRHAPPMHSEAFLHVVSDDPLLDDLIDRRIVGKAVLEPRR